MTVEQDAPGYVPNITDIEIQHCPSCGQSLEPTIDDEQDLDSLEALQPGMEQELARALERTFVEMGWAIRVQKGVTMRHVAGALVVRLTSGTG